MSNDKGQSSHTAQSIGGRIGGSMRIARHGGKDLSAAGVAAKERKARDLLDPDRELPEDEWAMRYALYRRAEMLKLAYQSAKVRRARKADALATAQAAADARVLAELTVDNEELDGAA
jgi:hypothetical protein